MRVAAFFVVVMGALAVLRKRDWRFAAWSAGLTAAYLGVLSLTYPAFESSLGLIGGHCWSSGPSHSLRAVSSSGTVMQRARGCRWTKPSPGPPEPAPIHDESRHCQCKPFITRYVHPR